MEVMAEPQTSETVPVSALTVDYFKKRIPFLKEFRLVEDRHNSEDYPNFPRLIFFEKGEYNSNVEKMTPDASKTIKMSHLNFFSDFTYGVQTRNEKTIHNFSIKNHTVIIFAKDPEEGDAVNSMVGFILDMMAKKSDEENSGHIEIIEQDGQIPKSELDKAIGMINEKMFKYGEHVQKSFDSNFLAP